MQNRRAKQLPSALEKSSEIVQQFEKKRPVIFLDYDGTLTPIVPDPSQALLAEKTRKLIARLSRQWTVVILSGRALQDVRKLVGLDSLIYAGSHGFNIVGPGDSWRERIGEEFLPALDAAEGHLASLLEDMPAVRLERKLFAIAVHYRGASEELIPEIERCVDETTARHPELRKTGGKKIFELRPNIEWDKGRALVHLLEKLHLDPADSLPLYIGDDTTDEDAFRAITKRGIGILVSKDDVETAASYVVRDPAEVHTFLEQLADSANKHAPRHEWSLIWEGFEPKAEKLREALCTLGNGYLATRGAGCETVADDTHYPGTYIAGVYNRLESNVAGKTIENESIVNVPNWLPLTFSIDEGDWFQPASVTILDYRQELSMREGVLKRQIYFEDKQGRRTHLKQRRFVHMASAHLAGIEMELTAENWSGTVHIRSAIDGRVENTLVERYRPLNNHHLEQLGAGVTSDGLIWLQVQTNQSRVRIGEAARTSVFLDSEGVAPATDIIQEDGFIAQEFKLQTQPGATVRVEKIVSIYSSRDEAVSDCILEAQDELRFAEGFAHLHQRHLIAWSYLWQRWHINVDAQRNRVEQILNLHNFHLLQTVSLNSIGRDIGVPPRGLHGEAYRGLIMWDETFIFPLLSLRIPDITRSLCMYRYRRLSRACWAAREAGYRGAMFPWQSGSNGKEQAQTLHLNPASGRWIPDNTQLQRHINIAIAYNIWQYYQVTGDRDFLFLYGAELIIQIARFWASKVEFSEEKDKYEILKVMGPDEFHDSYPDTAEPGVNNNAYTNIMVAWILSRVLDILQILPEEEVSALKDRLAVREEEVKHWDDIRTRLFVPFHEERIISQFEGYEHLKEFDWKAYRQKYGDIQRLDRILEAEADSPNRYKLSKQADVLMLFYLLSADELCELLSQLGYPFHHETIPANVEYYLQRTSHGSTLSRVVHAWVLARGNREMSWNLFQEAMESDIGDIHGTTAEGIHLGAMAGVVDLILRCYSGIEWRADALIFNPSLPSELKSLKFNITYRKCCLDVHITGERIHLQSRPGAQASIKVGLGNSVRELHPGQAVEFPLNI